MSKICPETNETVLYLDCLECDDKVCNHPQKEDNLNPEKKSIENMMKILTEECNRYGYKCEERFGIVYITTKFESWCFKPYGENSNVRLMHHNRVSSSFEWHKQFTKKLSYVQLVRYIYEHEQAKFYPKYIVPTVIKKHGRNSKCRSAKKQAAMPLC